MRQRRGPARVRLRSRRVRRPVQARFPDRADPATFDIGPWCPSHIDDPPEEGGVWLDRGQVWDVDGSFIENLAVFYDDPAWQMYDSVTGAVKVTASREACAAAARPDVDPQYRNHCVQCLASHVEAGLTSTYVIPVTPVAAARRGHETDGEGYHYHVGPPGSNEILACHTGQTGCVLNDPDAVCDATRIRRPPPPGARWPPPGERPPPGGRPPPLPPDTVGVGDPPTGMR